MSRKNIMDKQVCEAVRDYQADYAKHGAVTSWPYELLSARTGECEKVCCAAMERAESRGYLEYGVSLRTAWLTDKGKALLDAATT